MVPTAGAADLHYIHGEIRVEVRQQLDLLCSACGARGVTEALAEDP
jgi:hypothetical protein